MKTKFYLFFAMVFFFSCANDPCEDVECGANGNCNEETGTCICDTYYEGEFCGEESRGKYINDWAGTGECDYNPGNIMNIDLTITRGNALNSVKIQSANILQNFTMDGVLDENNDIDIPTFQAHVGSNTHDGKIVYQTDNSLLVTFNVYVNNVKNTCTYTVTK